MIEIDKRKETETEGGKAYVHTVVTKQSETPLSLQDTPSLTNTQKIVHIKRKMQMSQTSVLNKNFFVLST